MKTQYSLIIAVALLCACNNEPLDANDLHLAQDDKYNYSDLLLGDLPHAELVYVPTYSEISHLKGERNFIMTVTLSIRNISPSESVYIGRVDYHGADGALLNEFIDKTVEVKPLETLEFVVEYGDFETDPGSKFLVSWGAESALNPPVIQAVMVGTSAQQVISFVTNSVVINPDPESTFVDTTESAIDTLHWR